MHALAQRHQDLQHSASLLPPGRWNAAGEELYTGSDDCNIVVWAPAPEPVAAEREEWQPDSDGDAWSD